MTAPPAQLALKTAAITDSVCRVAFATALEDTLDLHAALLSAISMLIVLIVLQITTVVGVAVLIDVFQEPLHLLPTVPLPLTLITTALVPVDV
jgi:hypothetical protein